MESKIKFNPALESEGGKLYRQYCEEKGIDYSITAGANFCLGYMAIKPTEPGPVWVKATDRVPDHEKYVHCKSELDLQILYYDCESESFYNEDGDEYLIDEIEWLDESTVPQWTTADIKPEHNVGVLVFIPGEDNHITSGMWDISNEWVLLDEYRTPEEEVTHWMPLPAFPEGYTWNEIPAGWVDAFKQIAKEELGKLNQSRADLIREANNRDMGGAGRDDDRNEFAEWCRMQSNYGFVRGMGWMYSITNEYFSTDFMYELFKQQKEK